MSRRTQIARSSHTSARRHIGQDARAKEPQDTINRLGARSTMTLTNRVESNEPHRQYQVTRQQRTNAARMRPQEIFLQALDRFGRNNHAREMPHARVHTIHRPHLVSQFHNKASGSQNASMSRLSQHHRNATGTTIGVFDKAPEFERREVSIPQFERIRVVRHQPITSSGCGRRLSESRRDHRCESGREVILQCGCLVESSVPVPLLKNADPSSPTRGNIRHPPDSPAWRDAGYSSREAT